MIEERDLLKDTVRTCIMQKRVSFAFFKQWYWDCFDEDVQVSNDAGMLSRQSHDGKSHGTSDEW